MNTIKQQIAENIEQAVKEAVSEAITDLAESTVDNMSIVIDESVADDIIESYLREGANFTEDELTAIIHATCLGLASLKSYEVAQNAYKAEAEEVSTGGGVPVFSPEGMKHVIHNLEWQITEVGKKAKQIRDALDASL